MDRSLILYFSHYYKIDYLLINTQPNIYREINYIFPTIFFLFLFATLLLTISFLLSPKSKNYEKTAPYECGFNPFTDTRSIFEIHFYKVAILYIIFDLEIAFLLPWVVIYPELSFFHYWVLMLFVLLLVLGFVYEIITGALDWE